MLLKRAHVEGRDATGTLAAGEKLPVPRRPETEGGRAAAAPTAPPRVKRALWLFAHIPEAVLFAAMTALVVLVSMQVLLRSVLGSALDYYEEAGTVLFAWTSFLGAAVMVKRRGHYAVRLVVARLPGRVKALLRVVEDGIIVAVSGIFLVQAIKVTQLQSHEIMPVSGLSKAYYSASLPAGTALMLIYGLALLFTDARAYLRGEAVEEPIYTEGVDV